MRYFKFICDVICYENGESTVGRSNDGFDLLRLKEASKDAVDKVLKNVEKLEHFFDCWCDDDSIKHQYTPDELFNRFCYKRPADLKAPTAYEPGKIPIENQFDLNVFRDCIHSYNTKGRDFPVHRRVLLYAFSIYRQNENSITEAEFERRIRIVNNLIQNSTNEMVDSKARNTMPKILEDTRNIILNGIDRFKSSAFNTNQFNEEQEKVDGIDRVESSAFNTHQFNEEQAKVEFVNQNSDKEDLLFELEDHPLLYGQIGIVGTENIHLAKRFISLFTCDKKKIAYALMAKGDYGQTERNGHRRQYGSDNNSSWEALFHRSTNKGFDKTKRILKQLLETNESFSDDILKGIAETYCSVCEDNHEYPFNYYYIKYELSESYGKLRNKNIAENPYNYVVLNTKSYLSVNSYCPYLNAVKKLLDSSNTDGVPQLILDDYGQRLNVGSCHIYSKNNSFEWHFDGVESPVYSFISQNTNGIDTEDRIEKLKNILKNAFAKSGLTES